MPAAAIAAPVAGGIVGQIASSGDESAAQAALQQALAAYQNIQVPTVAEQQWNLANETSAGQLSPQALSAQSIGTNALSGIQTNPAYAAAQMQALQSLQQQGTGGLTAAERANLVSSQQAAAGMGQAQNAAIQQQMAARGVGGSGVQLAAQLSNSQNSANQASSNANSINAQAQQNALSALGQSGQLASQLQGTQFGQQASVAQAQNAINQFNTQNAQNVAGYNTQAANQAQAANLANSQNISNTNVGTANTQQAHNTGLYQQQFNDQMAQAAGEAGADTGMANFQAGQAQQTAGMYAGMGSGVGTAATAIGNQNATNNLANSLGNYWMGGSIPGPFDPNGNDGYPMASGGQVPGYAHAGEVKEDTRPDNTIIPGVGTLGDIRKLQSGGNFAKPAAALNYTTNGPNGQPVDPEDAATQGQMATARNAHLQQLIQQAQAAAAQRTQAVPTTPQLPPAQQAVMQAPLPSAPPQAMASGGRVMNPRQLAMLHELGKRSQGVMPKMMAAPQVPAPSMNPKAPPATMSATVPPAMPLGPAPAGVNPTSNTTGALMSGGGDVRDYADNRQDKSQLALSNGGSMEGGGHVKGKAKVKGDSPKNDVVIARLSPGELVVPRSVAQSEDEDRIMDFIKGVLSHKKSLR